MATLSFNSLPAASTVYATYASISATAMLLRTTFHQIVPPQLQHFLLSSISTIFKRFRRTETNPSLLTLVVDQSDGMSPNQLFDSFEIYMSTKTNPVTNRLKIFKNPKYKDVSLKLAKSGTFLDFFQGVEIELSYFANESKNTTNNMKVPNHFSPTQYEKHCFELCFENAHREVVIDSYIPHVLKEAKAIRSNKNYVQLHTLAEYYGQGAVWDSIILEHPFTFDKLAMEPKHKKGLMEDLDLFVKRKEYYKRVGRAWKRGYLLYGPPGTGKSSLIAAMANYLKFDIYDLQLMNVRHDSLLRKLLLSTPNRSILVIEDIDCSVDLPDRDTKMPPSPFHPPFDVKFTLSGLLNFIDGLWSSCGDERIIIFTTNNKDKLDPALLRPGRMDMHIHMSYLTMNGFKTLASNYLDIKHEHWRYREIEELIGSTQVTPAEVAEELTKIGDAELCLEAFVNFLKGKKMETMGAQESNKDDVGESNGGIQEPEA